MPMFEHYRQPLLPLPKFIRRMFACAGIAVTVLAVTLFFGTVGFHALEKFSWLDSFLNSVLIMTGLGVVNNVVTAAGKIFTSVYALSSSLAFFSILVILFTPLLHRLLHRFHLEIESLR